MKALAAALCVLAGPALAQGNPAPKLGDRHSFEVAYDPDQTYAVTMQQGLQCLVTLSPNEHLVHTIMVKNGAVEGPGEDPAGRAKGGGAGDVPLINNVPLIGAAPGIASVNIYTMDASQHEHTYALLITVVEGKNEVAPGVCLKLKFTYSAAQQEATALPVSAGGPRKPTWKEQQAAKAEATAKARLAVEPWYGDLRSDGYHIMGAEAAVLPTGAFDNTRLTMLHYPANTSAPAVYLVTDPEPGPPAICRGERPTKAELHAPETVVTTRRYNDWLEITTTGWHYRVRDGDRVGEVFNCHYDPIGNSPGTGTDSPDVLRTVISNR